jgi:hypothetical protein
MSPVSDFAVKIEPSLAARMGAARSIVFVRYDDPDAPGVAEYDGHRLQECDNVFELDGVRVVLRVALDVRQMAVIITEAP